MGRPRNQAIISVYRFRLVMRDAKEYLVVPSDFEIEADVSTPPKLAAWCHEYCAKRAKTAAGGKMGAEDAKDVEGNPMHDLAERSIRRNLQDGRMDPRTLDTIARALNVDVRLLMGKFEHPYEQLTSEGEKSAWDASCGHPKFHPYVSRGYERIDYAEYIKSVLLAHGVGTDAYARLTSFYRRKLEDELDQAVTRVLRKWADEGFEGFPGAGQNALLADRWDEELLKRFTAADARKMIRAYQERLAIAGRDAFMREPYAPRNSATAKS